LSKKKNRKSNTKNYIKVAAYTRLLLNTAPTCRQRLWTYDRVAL